MAFAYLRKNKRKICDGKAFLALKKKEKQKNKRNYAEKYLDYQNCMWQGLTYNKKKTLFICG